MHFELPPLEELLVNRPVPFALKVDDAFLKRTKDKLALSQYPEEQGDFGPHDWSQGAKVSKVKHLADYWLNSFDWEAQQEWLNKTFNHHLVRCDVPNFGQLTLHFTHARSSRPDAIPLLFSHGWPGSFVEAIRVIQDLVEPRDKTSQAFHVVAPSIPGFGFSPAPRRSGAGPVVTARAFKTLMTDVLGYKSFVTQGGDFGSFITRSIAIQYPQVVIGQHLNMFPVPPPNISSAPLAYLRWCLSSVFYTEFEAESLRFRKNFEVDQSGYLEQQKTRAQTLGFALGDSPLGLLAWFTEKFHDWVDVDAAFDDDLVLTLVMMHWIQGATPGLRFYREAFGATREAEKTFEQYVGTPTGVSMYPKEQLHCPKDWAQQVANVQFWREHTTGGHFSSLECPQNFLDDLRQFVATSAVQRSMKKLL